ncbi:39S ribosomal protein L34, mitochondrial [Plutella xylostella]|uniref:39S ribosomal protein L34, mitochondrial n=1 Tax=Plutella xylostella TaxID=51655 RepID=UPI0020323AE1|nr:39S ribosomal protein L34, mitochondrial [Plutella xylostella]
MSLLFRVALKPLNVITRSLQTITSGTSSTSLVKTELPLFTSIRNKVRCYFPRPNEVRRVRRHGWQTKISTPNGRRQIMRRILKGKFVLTH